jgi:hypothetical protein
VPIGTDAVTLPFRVSISISIVFWELVAKICLMFMLLILIQFKFDLME